ncbi:putative nuclease HARBI1 [Pseudolycoriella hygida]|uniref:Nuclease HARBI1 n=1 Tax=Pseudolycoriella hygida TaxID=35572 RepID=A0A9Q0MJB9_9DIPT|nr:putative nuclease HARBI1 [Pseudolycoriella hygida]
MMFLEIFKISRSVFMYLYNEIKHYFKAPRVHAVAPMTRLACCLQILSNRMLNQNIIRQNVTICPQLSVSQPVVSRSVEMVLNVFEKKLCPMWIKFPSTEMEISQCKKRFYDETGMVDVIGCVTCLNVSVLPFINNQDRFGNDNGVQSINVQLVCDYDMRILSVDPRYPGGVPDTDIWSVSTERDELERIYRNGDKHVLLAHSGYPLEPWLITPFVLDESSTQQQI